jgi:hypothetical protein
MDYESREIARDMFFLAQDGTRYAMSRVISYKVDVGDVVRVNVDGIDGEVSVDEIHWGRARAQTSQSFTAAPPGTYVLWLWRDERGSIGGYNRTNIIGWSVGADGYSHGWTVDGVDHGQPDLPPVLHPDGRVEVCFDQVYDSVEEWFATVTARSSTA